LIGLRRKQLVSKKHDLSGDQLIFNDGILIRLRGHQSIFNDAIFIRLRGHQLIAEDATLSRLRGQTIDSKREPETTDGLNHHLTTVKIRIGGR
jgi:hypothetical protein